MEKRKDARQVKINGGRKKGRTEILRRRQKQRRKDRRVEGGKKERNNGKKWCEGKKKGMSKGSMSE